MRKKLINVLKKTLIFIFVFIFSISLFSDIKIKADTGINFNITIKYQNGSEVISKESLYNSTLRSAKLTDYNDKIGEEFESFTPDSITSTDSVDSGVVYEAAFAGWKLISINGNTVSGDYYYPDNDFIYSNDIPFNSETFTNDTVIVFEPFFGKRVYLRDKYNFNDLSNLYGDNVKTAKIDWDTSVTFAYSISEAQAEGITGVGSSVTNPVSNITDAFTLMGTTGGEIVTINHYTFMAPENYYPYHEKYTTTGTYSFNLGTKITKGVVTFTGEGYGKDIKNTDGNEAEKANDKAKLSASNFDKYYANSYWYYINFRGNSSAINKSLVLNTFFRCDTVVEAVNVVGMREIYLLEGGRNNNDLHWYGSTNKRFVLMESIDFYKRTTSSGTASYSATNWTHSKSDEGYSGLGKGAGAYLHLYTGAYSINNGTENIYITIYGELDGSKFYDSYYHLRIIIKNSSGANGGGTIGNAKVNNVHCYMDTIESNNFYGVQQGASNSFSCNFYGVDARNCNIITSFEPVSNTKTSNIKEFALDLSGTKSYGIISSVYTGGYLSDNTGKTITVNFDKVTVNTSQNVQITDLYGGGNQIAVKVNISESLVMNINGGIITNVYGGSEGGDLNVSQKIKLNINDGTIDNVFGGGAGGLTELYLSNGPKNLKGSEHSDDYLMIYNSSGLYYRACSIEVRKVSYDFGDEIKDYDILVYTNFYIQKPYDITDLTNYYQSSMNVCLSNALVTTGEGIDITINGGTINKSVYGGGRNGAVNSNINIELLGGTVKGDIFGGGLGKDTKFSARAGVSGPSGVTSSLANALGYEVYYTGNLDAWTSEKFTDLLNNKETAYSQQIDYLTGIGKSQEFIDKYVKKAVVKADFERNDMLNSDTNGTQYFEVYSDVVETLGKITGDTNINLNGSDVIGSVFGGSDGAVANITGNTNVYINNGSVGKAVYGGGNVAVVTNNSNVTVSNLKITDVYGGGNVGAINGNSTVTVTGSANLTNVFAGSNQANVGGQTKLIINNGTITNAYGGNNLSGIITGIMQTEINGGNITNLYGGGNEADSTSNTEVLVNNGKVTNLYGGGKNADINSSTINIEEGTITSLYGGGYAGNVTLDTSITVNGGTITDNLYGGGYAGSVDQNTQIIINDGTITNIYGGGYAGDVVKDTTIGVSTGTINNIYGGGFQGSVYLDSNIGIDGGEIKSIFGGGYEGHILGNSNIGVRNGTIDTIYGGGYKGRVDTNTVLIIQGGSIKDVFGGGYEGLANNVSITVSNGEIQNNLYGGGFQGNITNSNITLSSGTIKGSVYGGGYAGDVTDTVVILEQGTNIEKCIYGGGYEGDVLGSTSVTVNKGTIGSNVYGGGYAGVVESTNVVIEENETSYGDIQINGSVFGGGEGITATVYKSTNVRVNLNLNMSVTEALVTTEVASQPNSGESYCEVEFSEGYSKINGSVYGGGDLGQIGVGVINTSNNTATITQDGTTEVKIENGYIEGSVFGGGSGIPKTGTYQLKMGTVYGNTKTYIYGGYINTNVYGGGTQSRVYFSNLSNDSVTLATDVLIEEKENQIVINGSVFGGGDRGNSATTNASVPTTIGDVSVRIKGKVGSKIYFISGGVYGDGNLCLVNGTRTIELTNFTTGSSNLKTFRSLQRADEVVLENTDIVLLGAVDLVEEGDNTVYSINRISRLLLTKGSTIKLDQIVKYLGQIESDYEFSSGDNTKTRKFVYKGNNGSNGYGEGNDSSTPLTSDEITSYQANTSTLKNVICVANGLYLEIIKEDGNYGKVEGLFTLQLLRAVQGEGGGFVYASIDESTGAFICETKFSNSDTYMTIIGNVSGLKNKVFTYYCWFIQGDVINYTIGITGYIGSDETNYEEVSIIPEHTDKLDYVLNVLEVNDVLKNAIISNKYTLVDKSTGHVNQEISLELKIGTLSLGFLSYDSVSDIWYLGGKVGYKEVIANASSNKLLEDVIVNNQNNQLSIVLYKSKEVNAEINNMQVKLEIDLFTEEGVKYSLGTSTLAYKIGFSIVRLVPVQNIYTGNDSMYSGLSSSEVIKITNGSSFTIEYQTRYIPIAFPKGSNTMSWSLNMKGYSYYIDELGNYLTVDESGSVISISPTLTLDSSDDNKILVTKNDQGKYQYTHDSKVITFDLMGKTNSTYLPKGTKIILIDMSLSTTPTYYYYICNSDMEEIDLDEFYIMGTLTKLKESSVVPEYKKLYNTQESSRITERLIFVFDLEQVEKEEYKEVVNNVYEGNIVLGHGYGNNNGIVDIMDYVKSETNNDITTYTRSTPKVAPYQVNIIKTGVEKFEIEFKETEYEEGKVAQIQIEIIQDEEFSNTQLKDGKLGVKVEVLDSYELPDGIEFRYNGSFLPKYGNKYLIIPITNYGTYTIDVVNVLGSIETELGKAKYQATLCYLPDSQYFNETIVKNNTIKDDDIKCNITSKTESSLKIETNTNYIKTTDTEIDIKVYTKNQVESEVTLKVYYLTQNGLIETNDIYTTKDITGSEEGISYKLQIQNTIQKGVYVLVFENSGKVESVSIAVK